MAWSHARTIGPIRRFTSRLGGMHTPALAGLGMNVGTSMANLRVAMPPDRESKKKDIHIFLLLRGRK